ncbi:uncharacterized protein LOC132879973 isoform X2 [Neoarius graeffei]|uniref:uncharacterized protein LOC132879973 isoform X2 n=1 Tax=Neoarius graeffei TaxID=443677 RepID=UPI00298BFF4F|nr:uncharacterized protein LOC132879973 isoform X2 [Neoarius graeffei]
MSQRKRSTVWAHFTREPNNKATCNICQKSISFKSGSTNNLHRHLKTQHPAVRVTGLRTGPTATTSKALKEILSQHEQNVRPSNNTASPGILSECAIDKLPEASGSAVVQMAAPPSSDTASSAQTQTAFPPSPSTASETASPSIDMELTLPPAHCSTGPGDVECDFCTERKHKAVKSCLICLTSFCETHLKPHNEVPALKRHKLEEATTQLQKMICPQHYKLMEVYCRTDQSAICCMCMMDEHAGHDTIMLASERNKKESELKKELMKSQQRIQEKEKVVQELKQSVNTIKLSAQTAVEGSERIFTELISSMEKKRWEVTELIRDQEKAELSRAERLLEQLELEIAVLQWRVTELEQLSYTHDHIHFLQRFQSVTSSEYKDSPIITINPRLSLDNVKEYLSGLKMRLEEFCAEEIKFSPPDSAVQMISPSEPQSREDFLKSSSCFATAQNMDSPLSRFLRVRGVPEDCLLRMEQDHIDATVLDFMDDNILAGYIPTYGDRIAARRFCLQHHGAKNKESSKHSMLEKLKKRKGIGGSDNDTCNEGTYTERQRRSYAQNNKWAEKKTRKVELGWIHEGKQVRKRKGGGTRTLDVPKESKKGDILQYAKDIFFPNGKNRLGNFGTFSHDIVDYQEEAIFDDVITVGELYSLLRVGVLRFYLCTKVPKDDDDEERVGRDSNVNEDVLQNDMQEEDEQHLQTVDTEALDTAEVEVMLDPHLGEPMAGQTDNTLCQPGLQLNEDNAVTSALFPRTSSALITPDTAYVPPPVPSPPCLLPQARQTLLQSQHLLMM